MGGIPSSLSTAELLCRKAKEELTDSQTLPK